MNPTVEMVIFDMSEKFRALDPYRLVHYEGIFNDRRYEGTSDMESQMYTSVENIKKFLAEHKENHLSVVSTPMRWEIPAGDA